MGRLFFPIRMKIMITLLFVVTAVVSVITFAMANMFHQDKRAYINDLTSIVALNGRIPNVERVTAVVAGIFLVSSRDSIAFHLCNLR